MPTHSDENLIGDFLYSLRESRDLTQDDLAKRSGKTLNTISRVERGLTLPQEGTAVAILSALRAVKELTNQEKKFVRGYMKLPDTHNLNEVETAQPPLTFESAMNRPDVPVQKWIEYTVSEIVATVGRERTLELLLGTAMNNNIHIPEMS